MNFVLLMVWCIASGSAWGIFGEALVGGDKRLWWVGIIALSIFNGFLGALV
jgi:hypothetical protein